MAHFELGKLRYYRGDPDRCLTEMKEAMKIDPLYTQSEEISRTRSQESSLT